MIPIYTRALAPSDYGVLELVSRSTDIISMVLAMGMAAALFRFHADAKSDKERERVISTAVTFVGIFGLSGAVLLAMASNPISRLVFASQHYEYYLRLALIATGLELCTIVPLALLRIHERSLLFTGINLSRLGAALVLNIYLVVIHRMGVSGVFISNLIGISLVWLVLLVLTRHYWRIRMDMRILRAMLAYSLPLVPSSLAMFVLNFGDRYFLRSYCGLQALGIYSLGYKLCMVMPGIIMEPLGLAWNAVVFTLADRADAGRIYACYFNAYMFCVVFFSLTLAATAGDLVSIMAERSYFDAWKVVPIVLLGFFAWASVNIFEIGVLLEKKTYFRTFSCLIGAVSAIAAYALFIPRWGAMGAAWATVCGFFAMAVSMWIFSNRLHPIPYDLRRAVSIIALAGGVYILTRLLPGYGNMPILIARLSIVMLFPGLLYLTGYFEPENIEMAKSTVHSFTASLPWCRSDTPSPGGGKLG